MAVPNPSDIHIDHRMLSVSLAAPAALRWLEAGQPARTLHVFDRVCNLINTDGAVLSLMLAPAEMNPLAFGLEEHPVVHSFGHHLQANSPVHVRADLLSVGNLAFDLKKTAPWPPRPDWEAARKSYPKFGEMLAEINVLLLDKPSADSLSRLLRPAGFDAEAPTAAWMQRALAPIQLLLSGLEPLDEMVLQEAGGKLAGLGLGLTPSGDDFIIGSMHALWAVLDETVAAPLCTKLLHVSAPRTNALSANYLEAAARGEAAQAWHDILAAITHDDVAALSPAVERLVNLGHTSGQDALAGFLLASQRILPS